jgi:hypothetical protein
VTSLENGAVRACVIHTQTNKSARGAVSKKSTNENVWKERAVTSR